MQCLTSTVPTAVEQWLLLGVRQHHLDKPHTSAADRNNNNGNFLSSVMIMNAFANDNDNVGRQCVVTCRSIFYVDVVLWEYCNLGRGPTLNIY